MINHEVRKIMAFILKWFNPRKFAPIRGDHFFFCP